MFLHVAHWSILAAGKLVTRQVLLPTQRIASLQPRFGGAFMWLLARHYVLSKSLMTRRRGVSSSLHSLNIEFGAARVAALPRAAWYSGYSWPTAPGATALLIPLLIGNHTAFRGLTF
jgi:hypothetical protein